MKVKQHHSNVILAYEAQNASSRACPETSALSRQKVTWFQSPAVVGLFCPNPCGSGADMPKPHVMDNFQNVLWRKNGEEGSWSLQLMYYNIYIWCNTSHTYISICHEFLHTFIYHLVDKCIICFFIYLFYLFLFPLLLLRLFLLSSPFFVSLTSSTFSRCYIKKKYE